MASTVSTGKVWSRSHASACGAISVSAKSRTTLRNASCSSVSSKSIGPIVGGRSYAAPPCDRHRRPCSPSSAAGCCTGLRRRHRRPRRARRRPGSGRSCSRSTGAPVCARFDARSGRPCRGPGRRGRGPAATRGRRSLDRGRVRAGRRRRSARRSPPATCTRSTCTASARRAAARRTPTSPPSAPRSPRATRRRTQRRRPPARRTASHVASASPERFLSRDGDAWCGRRPIKGTAADGRRVPRQGPGRERDDRRPRAQRPRPGVRVGLGRGAGAAARSSSTPGSSTSCRTVRGPAAPGRRLGRADRRHVPARARSPARPSSPRSTHIARLEPVARGRRTAARSAGSTPTGGRATSTSPSARSGSTTAELHFGTGGGITWDSTPDGEWEETELKARRLLRVASGALAGVAVRA